MQSQSASGLSDARSGLARHVETYGEYQSHCRSAPAPAAPRSVKFCRRSAFLRGGRWFESSTAHFQSRVYLTFSDSSLETNKADQSVAKIYARRTAMVSEHNFQRELNLSRRRRSGCDEPCGRTDPVVRENDRVGCSKVCMVEGVEDFRSELHVDFLGNRRTLQQREIHTREPWPAKHSSP